MNTGALLLLFKKGKCRGAGSSNLYWILNEFYSPRNISGARWTNRNAICALMFWFLFNRMLGEVSGLSVDVLVLLLPKGAEL